MIKNKMVGGLVAFVLLASYANAIELKMKYEPGQERTMNVDLDFEGKLDVGGDVPIQGSGKGQIATTMDLKVISVDGDGIATVEQSLSDIKIDIEAEAETPDGPKDWTIELTPDGGTLTAEGESNPIPADSFCLSVD